ncbi:MAG: ATP-binding protein [Pseudomonadota bacterium]
MTGASTFPQSVQHKVLAALTRRSAPQWIETDADMRITRSLGEPLVGSPALGDELTELLPCVVGAEDLAPIRFAAVNLKESLSVDVHIFAGDGGYQVLLVDVSDSQQREQSSQQQAHEIALLNRRLNKLTDALKASKAEVEAASAAKSAFMASMSHEFRTPLTAVLGYTDLLRRGVADPEEGVDGIQESADYLLGLIDNLLEHGATENQGIAIHPETVPLAAFFEALERQFRPLIERKNLQFSLNPAGDDARARLDPVRCRQVLTNLLSNALRHTATGTITLAWILEDGQLEVRVADTGSGIPAEDLGAIFQPFFRGRSAAGRPGAGLGLSISRRIAEALGGTLKVESEPGAGSTFCLRIPVGMEAAPEQLKQHALRVLVVDDDPNIRAVLELALADEGHAVVTCGDLEQTRELLAAAEAPQVALVDLDLYGADGLEVVELLKRFSSSLPVLAMSAVGSVELSARIEGAGCAGFVTKPFDLGSLGQTLQQAAGDL